MYGHLETDEDIVEHLEVIRQLQDEPGGFTAFIPWSFKPGNTPLEKIIPHYATSLYGICR
jgi:cyclic dehypoxanthinyl futalosine synthase